MVYVLTSYSRLSATKETFLWIIILMFKTDRGTYFELQPQRSVFCFPSGMTELRAWLLLFLSFFPQVLEMRSQEFPYAELCQCVPTIKHNNRQVFQ